MDFEGQSKVFQRTLPDDVVGMMLDVKSLRWAAIEGQKYCCLLVALLLYAVEDMQTWWHRQNFQHGNQSPGLCLEEKDLLLPLVQERPLVEQEEIKDKLFHSPSITHQAC
jgi:hypothetical protein